jgi:hypothetical protein
LRKIMDKISVPPFVHELDALRLFLETKPVGIVSDEIREVVERYLPELKHKLPPKIDVLPSVRRGWLN